MCQEAERRACVLPIKMFSTIKISYYYQGTYKTDRHGMSKKSLKIPNG